MIKRIALAIIIVVGLLVAYNLINQIMEAAKSSERLSQAAETVFKLEAKNRELKKKLIQIQTPDFVEREARDKLGLSKKGETVVIIPEDKLKLTLGASQSAQERRLPNWLGWWKVFF